MLLMCTVLAAALALPALAQDVSDTPAAVWSEPLRTTHDGTDTWAWEADAGSWELVVRGTPSLSDDHTALRWVAERDGFVLTVKFAADAGGSTVIRAVNAADGRPPSFVGLMHGVAATSEQLRLQLAEWLPSVANHLGLDADYRVERALMDQGLDAALGVIAALTSSAARLRGYSALARELGEPGGKALAQVLGQAAQDLTADRDMAHFLIEDLDLAFHSRATTAALLQALASVEDQDVLASVLAQLLVQTDQAPPKAMVLLLDFATLRLTRDNPMATLLDAISWQGLGSPAARAAWSRALATVEADGPHARAVASLLSIGDAPAAECALVVRSAVAHIETESLRAQALGEIHLEQLQDAELAGAYLEALESFRDDNVLTDLLTSLARRRDGRVATSVLWLRAAQGLPGDGRLTSLLWAIPDTHLADDAVQAEYRSLAGSLWSQPAKAEALARLPARAPAHPDHQE